MANRFQAKQHDLAMNLLAAHEGRYCLVGRITHKKCGGPLQIDHADSNPSNWEPANLHIVCRSHNLELRKYSTKEHIAKMARYGAKNEREGKKTKVDIPGDILASPVDYSSGSPEMQVNARCKGPFKDWLIEKLNKYGRWLKKDVINAGAYVFDCSPETTRKYLDTLTSSEGPFQEIKDEMGEIYIIPRKK
jgi:hypothetical protein